MRSPRQWSLAAIALAPFLCLALRAQAAECPASGSFILEVTAVHGPVRRDYAIPAARIAQLAGPKIARRHYPLLGMTRDTFAIVIDVQGTMTEGDDGSFCEFARKIHVNAGFGDRTVYVAREAAQDPCLRAAFLGHQLRHAHADDQALDEFMPTLKRDLRLVIESAVPPPSVSMSQARDHLLAAIQARATGVTAALERRRAALRQTVDSPENLLALRNACGGKGQRLAPTP